jgi:hypothetical protein
VSLIREHLRTASPERVGTFDKSLAIITLYTVRVNSTEHLKGHIVVHHLGVFQGLEVDSDPILTSFGLELIPQDVPSLGDGVGRRGRGWRYNGSGRCWRRDGLGVLGA